MLAFCNKCGKHRMWRIINFKDNEEWVKGKCRVCKAKQTIHKDAFTSRVKLWT